MHSLPALAALIGAAAALPAPQPLITPAPDLARRQDPQCSILQLPVVTVEGVAGIAITPHVCDCAGVTFTDENGMPAPSSTIGRDGQTTWYCSTTEEGSAFPISTRIAPTKTGQADNAAWASIQCDAGSLVDADADPEDRWNDSGAEGGWDSFMDWREDRGPETGDSLSNDIMNFFNGRDSTNCEKLNEPNCRTTVQCGQNAGGAADGNQVTAPAGWAIFNSFTHVNGMWQDLYDAVETGWNFADGRVGSFVETLSPITEDIERQKSLRLIYDAMQAGLFVALAPMFHSGFARVAWARNNPQWTSAGVDVAYGMIGTSFAIAKDSMDSLSTLPVQNQLSQFIVDVAKQWMGVVQDINYRTLNDPYTAIEFIEGGKFFGDAEGDFQDIDGNPLNRALAVEKLIFAASLSGIWETGLPGKHATPVIILSEDVPHDGSGCESFKPQDFETDCSSDPCDVYENDDAFNSGFVCDGENALWLVGVEQDIDSICIEPCQNSPTGCEVSCTPNGVSVRPLQGIDALGDFSLTVEEVAINARRAWEKNGKKNGWRGVDMLAGATRDEYESLLSLDLKQFAGIVNIPVCSMADVIETVTSDPKNEEANPNFPCPA